MARGDTKPWVELFDFLSTEEITPAKTQSNFADGRCYCRICDTYIEFGTSVKHAREHKREMRTHRSRAARQVKVEASRRLARARKQRATVTA